MMKGTWLRFGDSLSYVHLYPDTDFTEILRIKLKACIPRQVGLICAVSAASSPPIFSLVNLCPALKARIIFSPAYRERPGISLVLSVRICYEPNTT
jgi:hypothetical protein